MLLLQLEIDTRDPQLNADAVCASKDLYVPESSTTNVDSVDRGRLNCTLDFQQPQVVCSSPYVD